MTSTTITRAEQAEQWILEMDAVQSELEATGDYEVFESCKRSLALLKSEIESLGFQVERAVNGWRYICSAPSTQEQAEQKEERRAILFLSSDEDGLYAAIQSEKGTGTYIVRICSKWLASRSCTCLAGQHGKDCKHRLLVDRSFDGVRPTFREQCEGVIVSRQTIREMIAQSTARVAA